VSPPNVISVARFLCVPVVLWLILADRAQAAFALFVAAGLSDAVDGLLARRYGWTTVLGEHLDAVADKTLIVAVYATMGYAGWVPAWLVILVLFRDVSIVGGWLLLSATTGARRARPVWSSKVNTAAQIVLAGLVLGLQAGYTVPDWTVPTMIAVVTATTLASGAVYLRRALAAARDMESLE